MDNEYGESISPDERWLLKTVSPLYNYWYHHTNKKPRMDTFCGYWWKAVIFAPMYAIFVVPIWAHIRVWMLAFEAALLGEYFLLRGSERRLDVFPLAGAIVFGAVIILTAPSVRAFWKANRRRFGRGAKWATVWFWGLPWLVVTGVVAFWKKLGEPDPDDVLEWIFKRFPWWRSPWLITLIGLIAIGVLTAGPGVTFGIVGVAALVVLAIIGLILLEGYLEDLRYRSPKPRPYTPPKRIYTATSTSAQPAKKVARLVKGPGPFKRAWLQTVAIWKRLKTSWDLLHRKMCPIVKLPASLTGASSEPVGAFSYDDWDY